MHPIISFANISKSFGGIQALSGISLHVDEGIFLGLIGENGAGKSTLMNILGGNIKPDEGSIRLRGERYSPERSSDAAEAGIAFIHQELNLFKNLSVADNLFIQNFPTSGLLIRQKEILRRTREWIDMLQLEIAPDDLVEKLQPGERQMVEIAKALNAGAEIIIFDEPTTSLTKRETEKLFDLLGRLKKEGKTIIYISHILEHVKKLCDQIAVMRDGKMVSSGPSSEFAISEMIESMCGRDIKQLYPEYSCSSTEETVLKVEKLTQKGVVKDISFSLHSGEILGMFGLMGSGRSECARLIFGLESPDSGSITIGKSELPPRSPLQSIQNRIAFVTEDRRTEGLLMEASIRDNLGLVSLNEYSTRSGFLKNQLLNTTLLDIQRMMNVKSSSPQQKVKNLSGGNQQKVVFGKWLVAEPLVFILDEPSRGIDVGAKSEIYSITSKLAEKGTGILLISSELDELIGVCDRILVMRQGQIVGEFKKRDFEEQRLLQSAFGEPV